MRYLFVLTKYGEYLVNAFHECVRERHDRIYDNCGMRFLRRAIYNSSRNKVI